MCGHSSKVWLDRPDREGARIDERGRAVRLRSENGGAVAHLAVRERRPVLDREHALFGDLGHVAFDVERRRGEDDTRVRVVACGSGRGTASIPSWLRAVDLVHDADVGHAQVRLTRVVAELVARDGADRDQAPRCAGRA